MPVFPAGESSHDLRCPLRELSGWLLTRSAQQAARHPGSLRACLRGLTKWKSRNVAITAVTRQLVTITFLMLKSNEPYRYARPTLMRTKLATLEKRSLESKRARSSTNLEPYSDS
jgi:hypothetical protein